MFHSESNHRRARGVIARKVAVGLVVALAIAFGVALIVLPGLAVVVIPIGVGILATELATARGFFSRLRERARLRLARRRDAAATNIGSGLPVVLAMVTVVASFSASVAFAHFRQRHIGDELGGILHDEYPGLARLSAIRTDLRRMGGQVDEYVARGETVTASSRDDIAESQRLIDGELIAYRALPSFPGEPELVSEIERRVGLVEDAATRALDRSDAGSTSAAEEDLRTAFHPRLEQAYGAVEHLSVLNTEYIRERAESIFEARRAGLLIENVLGLASILSAIAATLLVRRSLRVRARLVEERGRLLSARATELEAFAGRVAHDLKNPLGAMALRVMLARREQVTPRLDKHLEKVAHQLERMNQIIDGLLEFALAGARPRLGEHVSLRDVTLEVVSELLPAADAVRVELRADPLPKSELACTEGALTSVLANLIGNAVKYVVEGRDLPHRITLHARDGGRATRVDVEDNGPGLPVGGEQVVFEPFRRLNDRQPGIGLGLATVKKIVEAYGGRVGVESTPGKGSSFWFEIPNARSDAAVAC